MLLRQLNFGDCEFTITLRLLQRKNYTFQYLQFLLLLSETGLGPESCLAIYHPRTTSL